MSEKPGCFGKNNCINLRWNKCSHNKECLDEWLKNKGISARKQTKRTET